MAERAELHEAAVVVPAAGDVDRETVHVLREQLERALHEGRRSVVVDLADVRFIDSLGLAVLADARSRMGPDQRLLLCHLSERVHRILLVTAFDELAGLHVDGQPWPWPDVVRPEPPPGRRARG